MGSMAKGELIELDDRFATYRFAGDSGEWEGVLVIPVDDVWSWRLSDSDERPRSAASVVAKVIRRFNDVGEWPPFAFHSLDGQLLRAATQPAPD